MNKKPPQKSRMGGPPRITNRERVLLALVDAPDFQDQYELPRRFSQVGLSQRLGMAQSHVSRALNILIEEGLITHKRKRVVGERRRVTTYSLSSDGIDQLHELIESIEMADVLTLGEEGTLEQIELRQLVDKWTRRGGQQYPDALSLTDLLREATIHDGLPLLEAPPAGVSSASDEDLSSEAIGLHLELAELRRSQGDLASALEHLDRAARLHHKRGNPLGQVRCVLAAASLGAQVENPTVLIDAVATIREPTEKMDACLMLHDAILSSVPDSAANLLNDLPNGHPEVLLRQAEAALRKGESVSLSDIPKSLPGATGLRQDLWAISYLRLQCRVASMTGTGWPIPMEVDSALVTISNDSKQPHSMLYGELTLAHLRNPVLGVEERKRLLQAAWDMQPPLPTIGHIGFQLASLLPSADAIILLINLQQKFQSMGDESGVAVCNKKLESL